MRRAALRRSLRLPSTYVYAAVSFAVVLALQHFFGVGDVAAGERPEASSAGVGLLVALSLSVSVAGLTGPELTIPRTQAQWLITVPGGAAAAVAVRLLSSVQAAARLFALVIIVQLLTSGEIDLAYASCLALWRAGLGPSTAAANAAFAAWLEAGPHRHWRRAGSCAVLGGVGFALAESTPLMRFLGAPAVGSDAAALASATMWLGLAGGLSLVAFRRAEALVVRAVGAGGPGGIADQRRRRTAKRGVSAPDSFTLQGPRVSLWLALVRYRRLYKQWLAVVAVLVVTATLLSIYAGKWLPVLTAAMLFFLVMLTTNDSAETQPVGSSGSLLPFSIAASFAWRLPIGVLASVQMLSPAMVSWAVAGPGTSNFRSGLLWLILPTALFVACLGLRARDLVRGQAGEHSRLQRLRAFPVLGLTAGLYFLEPGLLGAALASIILMTAALVFVVYEISAVRRLGGPVRTVRIHG